MVGGVMVEVEVGLGMDPDSGSPVLVLRDPDSGLAVPVWIGHVESIPIALHLEGRRFPRPLAPDLMERLVRALGGSLERVVVTTIRDGVYYASLELITSGGEPVRVDCRPSDAVALALCMGRPVYVSEEVLRAAGQEIEGP